MFRCCIEWSLQLCKIDTSVVMGPGSRVAVTTADDAAYLFLFTGLRFSMNAAMPSERSSSAKVE